MYHYERVIAVRTNERKMAAIGVDRSLSNSAIYEDICFKNSNKVYKYEGKRDKQ